METDNTGDLSEKNVDTSIPTEDLGKDLDLEEKAMPKLEMILSLL